MGNVVGESVFCVNGIVVLYGFGCEDVFEEIKFVWICWSGVDLCNGREYFGWFFCFEVFGNFYSGLVVEFVEFG